MSDVGLRHRTNQDAARIERFDNGDVLIVIADGVSSAQDAERASVTAVDTLCTLLRTAERAMPVEQLIEAFHAANEAVKGIPYDSSASLLDYPQTTLVAAIVRGPQAWIAWVGDSRAYVLGVNSRVLTTDDSWYAVDVAAGVPKDVAIRKKNAHAITQCLGMREDEMVVHTVETPLETRDTLLLCSDGLWNYFEEAEALKALLNEAQSSSAETAVACFIKAANRAGGRDNISAAVLKISG